ncbi:MAG: heme exporter protein CcmD [Acidimicrobiia bacterium]|nr:heme exporter protein CcmD [Acidimicrobiia bacterium]
MTHVSYLIAGYGATFVVLASYSAWIVSKKRALARELSPEERDTQWP